MVRADAESRIRRSHEIDMKLPPLNLGQCGVLTGRTINREQKFISTRRRRAAGTKTGRNQTVGIAQACRKNCKGNRVGRAAIDHRSAVERKDTDSDKCRRIRKHIDREIVTIRPESELRVVAEVSRVRGINLDCVKVPAATNRITGFRHANALIKQHARKIRECEIGDHPTISNLVVENKWVAVVEVTARRADQ